MPYYLRGKLYGYICRECPRPLWGVTVRIYAAAQDEGLLERAVADPRHTVASINDDAVEARAGQLLAEAEVGEDGSFEIAFDRKNGYQGGPVEVDLRMQGLARIDRRTAESAPRQIHLTTLQPVWRERQGDRLAYWEYYLPSPLWCLILSWFGIWTICGRLTHCTTGYPVPGVRVRAFDVDWLQDDALGSAITDGTGRFQIYYMAADFQQGTWADVELFGGPDLYFRVETLSGVPLLAEPSSRGRSPDRENVGHCFCVELCLEKQPPVAEAPPVFDSVGFLLFTTDIDSAPGGTGLAVGNKAFYSNLRLNGSLPKKLNGNPMEYRFEWRTTDETGNTPGPWKPVAAAQIDATLLGKIYKYAPTSASDPNPVKTSLYYLSNADYTADGFIRVPQQSDTYGPEGFFDPGGNQIMLISSSLANFGALDMTGVKAGGSSTVNGAPLAADRHFSLRMMVREKGDLGAGTPAGTLEHIAINNTVYNNVAHHPAWSPKTDHGVLGVGLLDVQELTVNGCKRIENTLNVLVTATHPHLGAITIGLEGGNAATVGPGGTPAAFTLPAPVPGEQFGTATNNFDAKDLKQCGYILSLSVGLLLTTGESGPGPLTDQIGFAKA